MKVELGDTVKDTITGFSGVVLGIADYYNGCRRVQVQPKKLIKNEMIEAEWIDEVQLKVIKHNGNKEQEVIGGDREDPSIKNP